MKNSTCKNPVVIGELIKLAMEHLNNLRNEDKSPQNHNAVCPHESINKIGERQNDIHKFLNAA